MKRRQFIMLAGSALVPRGGRDQQPGKFKREAVLTGFAESDPEARLRFGAFQQALQELGWIDGFRFGRTGARLPVALTVLRSATNHWLDDPPQPASLRMISSRLSGPEAMYGRAPCASGISRSGRLAIDAPQ